MFPVRVGQLSPCAFRTLAFTQHRRHALEGFGYRTIETREGWLEQNGNDAEGVGLEHAILRRTITWPWTTVRDASWQRKWLVDQLPISASATDLALLARHGVRSVLVGDTVSAAQVRRELVEQHGGTISA
jgi:hypothetical protein